MSNRRSFLKNSALAVGAVAFSAKSYARIIGANDRVRVGIIGFSDRFKNGLLPAFAALRQQMNFEITAVSDPWGDRRTEAQAFLKEKYGQEVAIFPNNEALYGSKSVDAVFISTPDFQHALQTIEAVQAGCDAYTETPLAETMADARAVLSAVRSSGKIVQVGLQRRSADPYRTAAASMSRATAFGSVEMAEIRTKLCHPGSEQQTALVAALQETNADWQRYRCKRPIAPFDPLEYAAYGLLSPQDAGIPVEGFNHLMDTVHWFSGCGHPRSVVASGGWAKEGHQADALTIIFDYGPDNDLTSGFQVHFTAHASDETELKEVYYANGRSLQVAPPPIAVSGVPTQENVVAIDGQPCRLTGVADAHQTDALFTQRHVKNWMECVRSHRTPNAPIEAGYHCSIAQLMTTAAYRTGQKITFDAQRQEIMIGSRVWQPFEETGTNI
jgi:predicted dehydrogenase